MKYVVEFEMHSDIGGTLGEAVQKAMSAFGGIDKLKIVPVRTYTLYIQVSHLQLGADKP